MQTVLSSNELIQFLDVGYLVLELDDVIEKTHDHLFSESQRLYSLREKHASDASSLKFIADDIHLHAPAINQVLQSNRLTLALTTLLGIKHHRFPHSFIHRASSDDQGFHKDSPLPWGGRGGMRSHRPNWAMAFYYPQETTVDIGATEVLPGTQYWNVNREHIDDPAGEDRLGRGLGQIPSQERSSLQTIDGKLREAASELDRHVQPLRLEVPKGAVVLVHFDLFHRGTRCSMTRDRFMWKFWYVRLTHPAANPIEKFEQPTYRIKDKRRQSIVGTNLRWLRTNIKVTECVDEPTADTETQDAEVVATAYDSVSKRNSDVLADLASAEEERVRAVSHALASTSSFGYGTAKKHLSAESELTRKYATFLFGEIAELNQENLGFLSQSLTDRSVDVRAIGVIGFTRITRRNTTVADALLRQCLTNVLQLLQNEPHDQSRMMRFKRSSVRQLVGVFLLTTVATFGAGRIARLVKSAFSDDFLEKRSHEETDQYARALLTSANCQLKSST